jgi:histidine kinase
VSKSASQLESWKKRLIKALGPNGQLVTQLAPDLEQIIGPQPTLAHLNPREAQNRLHLVFFEFIKVFAQENHPFVFFLDDLQWSDHSTLVFLKYLLTSFNIKHMLFVCCYRDIDVNTDHSLPLFIKEISNSRTLSIQQLSLLPLEKSHIEYLVRDTLRCSRKASEELSSFLYEKTKGNPFFVDKMLDSFHRSGLIRFLPDSRRWDWNMAEIEGEFIDDNVIDFLVRQLRHLTPETIKILSIASCFGNNFDIRMLSLINEQTHQLTYDALLEATKYDIIFPLDSEYRLMLTNKAYPLMNTDMRFRFQYDYIQQAVYSLTPDEQKTKMHLQIGKFLLKKLTNKEIKKRVFDLVSHLNIGRDLIISLNERIQLSDLNVMAGKKAKDSSAYGEAREYFKIAKSMLSDQEWIFAQEKLFEILLEETETTFLIGNIKDSKTLCLQLFDMMVSNIDKAAVYNLNAKILEYSGEPREEVLNKIREGLDSTVESSSWI